MSTPSPEARRGRESVPGWREPTNTYILVALESGNRKQRGRPSRGGSTHRCPEAQARALAADIARARAKRDVAEKRLEHLKKQQAANATDDLAVEADTAPSRRSYCRMR